MQHALVSLPIETYRSIRSLDLEKWKSYVEISFRRSLLHLITCIWDTRYRYLSEPFRRSGQLFREIRNYVRVGNWCDPAVTDVYMYIYTEILFENKRISFWETLRRVHSRKTNEQTGRGTIKSLGRSAAGFARDNGRPVWNKVGVYFFPRAPKVRKSENCSTVGVN